MAVQGATLVWNDAIKIGSDNTYEAIQADAEDANTAAEKLEGLINEALTWVVSTLAPAETALGEAIKEGAVLGRFLKSLPPTVAGVIYKAAEELAGKVTRRRQ